MSACISVVIPVYNGEQFVDFIAKSLQNQTFRDFEVIFVNDGSKDDTLTRLKTLEATNPELYHVVSQENRGVSAARNTGLSYATGT